MCLTTERLTLRPWRADEADVLLDIRRRPDVARWLSDPTPWTELATAQERIATWGREADPPLGSYAIVPHGAARPVGNVKLAPLPGDVEVEIGWMLHPDATGNGYAREAAARVLTYAADEGIDRVWAIMWPDNERSAAVCRAIGMTDLGVVPDPWYGSPEEPDSRVFRWDAPGLAEPS